MSRVEVSYGVVAALVAAETVLGRRAEWNATSDVQGQFLRDVFDPCRDEVAQIAEIEARASRNAGELNAFLEQRGFAATFRPFAPDDFGSAAVLDLFGRWARPARPVTGRTREGREFPAVITDGPGVTFFQMAEHPHPIARMKTATGDRVYMTMHETLSDHEVLGSLALRLARRCRRLEEFEGLVFPMVDLSMNSDLGWTVGLASPDVDGRIARIASAQQQNTLRINETGFRARSATTLHRSLGATRRRPPHVIDRPFLFWVERTALTHPLCVAWLTEECWRRPPDLAG